MESNFIVVFIIGLFYTFNAVSYLVVFVRDLHGVSFPEFIMTKCTESMPQFDTVEEAKDVFLKPVRYIGEILNIVIKVFFKEYFVFILLPILTYSGVLHFHGIIQAIINLRFAFTIILFIHHTVEYIGLMRMMKVTVKGYDETGIDSFKISISPESGASKFFEWMTPAVVLYDVIIVIVLWYSVLFI